MNKTFLVKSVDYKYFGQNMCYTIEPAYISIGLHGFSIHRDEPSLLRIFVSFENIMNIEKPIKKDNINIFRITLRNSDTLKIYMETANEEIYDMICTNFKNACANKNKILGIDIDNQ
jgi:hypothetical protein